MDDFELDLSGLTPEMFDIDDSELRDAEDDSASKYETEGRSWVDEERDMEVSRLEERIEFLRHEIESRDDEEGKKNLMDEIWDIECEIDRVQERCERLKRMEKHLGL